MNSAKFLLLIFLFLENLTVSLISFAGPNDSLIAAITNGIDSVDAFQYLAVEATKLGVRVFLHGGTAAGYARYARDHAIGNDGDWSLASIYRSNQDMDIVVDGPSAASEQLKSLMEKRFPVFRGNKSAWDFTLLRQGDNKHISLLSGDFLHQNNDSYSTGLIELSTPPKGEPRVLDLMFPKSANPPFLSDIANNEITFYRSASHASTRFSADARNPEIISALRYLYKAFQSGATMRPEDLAEIRKIIAAWRPADWRRNQYVVSRIEDIGTKMLMNAADMESAWRIIDSLGLRQKLIAFGDAKDTKSLAWLMGRKPLPSMEIRPNSYGKTARDLFKELGQKDLIITHETSDWQAYESIISGADDKPNFFISHQFGYVGETARLGDGVYALVGERGRARSGASGLAVRMELNPDARVGVDFDYRDGEIVLKNREAVRVLPEDITNSVSLEEIIKTRSLPNLGVQSKGVRQRLMDKIVHDLRPMIKKEITQLLNKPTSSTQSEVEKLLNLIDEKYWSELIDEKTLPKLANQLRGYSYSIRKLYALSVDKLAPELTPAKTKTMAAAIAKLISEEVALPKPNGEFVYQVIAPLVKVGCTSGMANVLQSFVAKNVTAEDKQLDPEILDAWFSLPEAKEHPEIIRSFMEAKFTPKRTTVALYSIYKDSKLVAAIPSEAKNNLFIAAIEFFETDRGPWHDGSGNSLLLENFAKHGGFSDNEAFLTLLEEQIKSGRSFPYLSNLLRFGLPKLKNPRDPRIWKLLGENWDQLNLSLSDIAKAMISPELQDLPESEAWVNEMVSRYAGDVSNNGWPQSRMMDAMKVILKEKAWMQKDAATGWINQLLTVKSPTRGNEMDAILKEILATSAAEENPMHSAWVASLATSRSYRTIRGARTLRPSANCPSLFEALWNPLGVKF